MFACAWCVSKKDLKQEVNPLSATGPLLGHTYNYVECHGATFGPLVYGLILKILHNNLKQYGRLYEKNHFATRCSILFSILAICLCAICKNMRVLLLHFDAG